ncbi:MAG: PAS domain S-box protein, partial [Gammaproteobacteria bacterium]|nr:PAS domain S-box protein [Gammaproteobacteria bacterium]
YSHQNVARESSIEDAFRLQGRMLEKMSDAVILVDSQNGSIIFANSSAEKMFAYDKNELLGNSIASFNLSAEGDVDKTFTGIASHLRKRGEWQGEVHAEKRNGETICCEFDISTFTHPDPVYGEVWLWVASDITQRKTAENELQQERDFANNLLNTAPMVVLLLDTEGYIKYINPYFERLSGYQLDEVVDKDWFSTFLPERDRDSIRELFRQARHDVPTEGNLNPIVTRSGVERQIKWNDRCIYDQQGNISGVLAVGQDVTEQYFVEKELQQFKNTLDQTLDCVFMFDESLRFTYFNEGAMQQVGYTQDELLSMSPYDIKPFISEEDFRRMVAPLLAGSQASISFETVHQHKNGNQVPVEIFLQYVKSVDESGRFVAIVRDITERKLAEQSLQAASEFNQKIISESPIGMAIYNSDGQCIAANNAVSAMIGATKEQVLAQNYKQIASWKKSGLLEVAKKSIQLQEKQRTELSLTTTFGKQVFLDCLLVPFKSRDEQHLLLMSDDITERKLAEQELENLFELSLDMVATGNLQGYFTKVNSAFTRILGYEREELFSQPFTAFVYEEDLDITVAELQKAAAGETKLYLVNRYKCKDGGLKWVEWNVLADVKDNTFYATGRDITQRKEAEEELATYRQKLEELVEERTRELKETQNELVRKERLATLGQLTATVSHELRNPLGAMRPSLFIVDKSSDRSDTRVQNALSRIDRNIDRCDHIIDEL